MSKIPVLLLISRHIDLHVLNQSPRYQRYRFSSLTALDYLGNGSTGRKGQTLLTNMLDKRIKKVKAQYLLAHLGLAFDRYPVEFLTAVLDVHTIHPRLKIGLDKGLKHATQYLRLFAAPDPEVKRLLNRLGRNRSAFDADGEMAVLAGALY
jgi:hypothetical protein